MTAATIFLSCPKCTEIFEAPAAEANRAHRCPACGFAEVWLEECRPPVVEAPRPPSALDLFLRPEFTKEGLIMIACTLLVGWLVFYRMSAELKEWNAKLDDEGDRAAGFEPRSERAKDKLFREFEEWRKHRR